MLVTVSGADDIRALCRDRADALLARIRADVGDDPHGVFALARDVIESIGAGTGALTIAPPAMPVHDRYVLIRALRRSLTAEIVDHLIATPDRLTAALVAFGDVVGRFLILPVADQLAALEARYRQLFDSNPMPSWVFDNETLAFLEVNDAAIRKYSYTRDEFLAMRIVDIRPAEDVDELIAQLRDPPAHAVHTKRHRTKDGRTLWVEAHGHEFVFAGRAARLVVINDVTERRAAEERARRSEEQLRQAQKMEAVGLLAGGIAHDFNNILLVMQCAADFAREQLGDDHPARVDVEEIRDAARRAAELTGQLLTFSRRKVIEPARIDVNQVIVDVERMLRRVIGEDIDLHTVPLVGLPAVCADRGLLEQMLLNLVVNARDAMPDGGTLVIETAHIERLEGHPSAQGWAMLAVSDTGCGMDAETLPRIFEPFFTTKGAGQGSGLGLSTVYGIVEQSGGHVQVYSEPGHGTTFKVYLPVVAGAAVTTTAPRAPVDATKARSAVVLLVEDDPRVRLALHRSLADAGHRVLAARDASEALEITAQRGGEIDVLLTDMMLPGTSGPELAAELLRQRPDLDVVFMSGYPDRAVVRTGRLPADVHFMQKPFTPEAIVTKLRQILGA